MKLHHRLPILSIAILLLNLVFTSANAAEFSFKGDTKNLNIGDAFKVDLMIDTQNESVNAVEGKLVFSGNLLEVKSIDFKEGSFVNIWAQEPNVATITKEETKEIYSEISFSGGVIGAYKNAAGKLFTVTFTAKGNGKDSLKIGGGKVLLNDGKATLAKLKLSDYAFRVGGLTYEEEQDLALYLLDQVPNGRKNKIRDASKCGFAAMNSYFANPKLNKKKKKSAYFDDINRAGAKSAWCVPAADYYYDLGVIQGRAKGIFGVQGTVSRYEVATILARELAAADKETLDKNAVTPFVDDASIPSWARGPVSYLNKKGIFKGFDLKDGTFKFGGEQNILNIDAAIVLYRTFAKK